MEKYNLSEQELKQIIEIARFAPSVHNTQPWQVSNGPAGLQISIESAHKLGPGDPTGRQTTISLGIFTEALCLAAAKLGLSANVEFKENKVKLSFNKDSKNHSEKIKLLKKRATDRSIYSKVRIDEKVKDLLEKCNSRKSVRIWVIKDEDFIRKLAKLTSKGIKLALSNPEFRSELSQYLVRTTSRKKRGISVKSLYIPWLFANLQPEILKMGLTTGKEAALEEKRWLSASAVILITTDGDLHDDWFDAGRTYLSVSLAIEDLGLSQATSAAAVEAATFHEDVEEMLGTRQRLQAVIRIGKGAEKRRYSPRISAEELITSN